MGNAWDYLETAIEYFEATIAGRKFTAQERVEFEKWYKDTRRSENPSGWRMTRWQGRK